MTTDCRPEQSKDLRFWRGPESFITRKREHDAFRRIVVTSVRKNGHRDPLALRGPVPPGLHMVAGGLGVGIEVLADGGLVNLDLLAKFFTSLNSQNVTSFWIKVFLLLHLQFGILKS